MSNYTKSTNFATKDDLAAGSPLKRVKGAELNDEFNDIATAVATKANSNNTALTGIPVAPTASAITNNTQVATTAYTTSGIAAAVAALPVVTLGVIGVNVDGTLATGRTIFVDTDAPTGGANGDIWFEY